MSSVAVNSRDHRLRTGPSPTIFQIIIILSASCSNCTTLQGQNLKVSSSVPINTLLNKLPKGKSLSSLDEETVRNLLSEIVLARREGLSCTSSTQFLLLTVLQHDKEVLLINSKVSASNHRLSEQRDAPQRSPPHSLLALSNWKSFRFWDTGLTPPVMLHRRLRLAGIMPRIQPRGV